MQARAVKHVNLDIYRVVYAVYVLAVAPRWLNPEVGSLPAQMFVAPLGVNWWLSSAPSPGIIVAVEFIRWAALVLVLLKLMPRAASLVAFVAWLWLGGVESGFGKIDHDLIMAAPLLAFAAFGWDEPGPRGVYVVLALLASFFFSAGLIKLFSGWLNFKASAVAGILNYYEAVYGRDISAYRALPFAFFKTFDIATVVLECSFVVVLFRPRLIPIWLLVAWGFHEGIHHVLGINFKKLSVLYLLFLPLDASWAEGRLARLRSLRFEPLARWLVAAAIVVAAGLRTLETSSPMTFNWGVPGARALWEWVFPAWLVLYVAREAVRALRRRSDVRV